MGRIDVAGRCPDCKGTEIVVDESNGQSVCSQCGLVLEAQFIDDTHDVRIFEDNQNAQRIEIANPQRDGKGGEIGSITLKGKGNTKYNRKLGTTQKRVLVVPATHVENIEEYASAVNCGRPVVERAHDIYKEFVENGGYIKGKNAGALQVACLYIAGRQMGQMKLMKELQENTDVKVRDIRKGDIKIKSLVPSARFLDINDINFTPMDAEEETSSPEIEVMDIRKDPHVKAPVDRLCNALKFEFRQRKCAEEMAYAVAKFGLMSMQQASIAAAIVWTLSRLFGRNDDINTIVKHSVAKTTLRKAYKLLEPHFTSLIPRDVFGDPKDWEKKLKRP